MRGVMLAGEYYRFFHFNHSEIQLFPLLPFSVTIPI
jgi:hypothetical protein